MWNWRKNNLINFWFPQIRTELAGGGSVANCANLRCKTQIKMWRHNAWKWTKLEQRLVQCWVKTYFQQIPKNSAIFVVIFCTLGFIVSKTNIQLRNLILTPKSVVMSFVVKKSKEFKITESTICICQKLRNPQFIELPLFYRKTTIKRGRRRK